jgi:hemoglobin
MAFYDTLLDSEEIGPYFDDIEMGRLIDHQTKFVANLLGGPASFSNDQLRRAHATLQITAAHFDEMKSVLNDTLLAHGIEPADAESVMASIESRRDVIVAQDVT